MLNSFPVSTGWNNTEFASLANQQMSTLDEGERKELVDRMQVLIAENVPTIPLLYRNVYSACNQDKFDGFFYTPGGVGGGVPTEYNKLVFIYGEWKGQSTASEKKQYCQYKLSFNECSWHPDGSDGICSCSHAVQTKKR